MSQRLPDGFVVRLRPDVRVLGGGRVLIGGSPLTALSLSAAQEWATPGAGRPALLTVDSDRTAVLAERLLATNLAEPVVPVAVDPAQITVVIPVRDRPEQLDRALAALTGLACIVVDDASLDVPAVRAVTQRHGAELICLPINLGPAGARNAGLARVFTPFVGFVDSDVTATCADLTQLAAHFADPSVALVGPLIHGESRSAAPSWFERYDQSASSLTLGTTPASVRPGAAVAWLPSACLVGRTAAIRDEPIGGFDPSLRVGEDVDLVWRLVEQGARVRYEPGVVVHHDTRATLRQWAGRKFFYGTGSAQLARRHGSHTAPARLSPVMAVAGLAILLRHRAALPMAVGALLWGARSIRQAVPDVAGRDVAAVRLAARGLGWAVRQESALMVRHWWPGVAVGALCSRQARRALVTALAVDAVVAAAAERGRVSLPTALAARRVDDAAYGAGVWVGSVRARTLAALAPHWAARRGTSGRHRLRR